jgi:hypothetical protein
MVDRIDVHLENWVVDAVAEAIAQEPNARRALRPRLVAYARVEGTELVLPAGQSSPLSPREADMLLRCDGSLPAAVLGADLVSDGTFASEQEALDQLEDAIRRRWVVLAPDLPVGSDNEAVLVRWVEAIADKASARRAAIGLSTLRAARDQAYAAFGDPRAVVEAQRRSDAALTALTGTSSTRSHGQTYGARTSMYLEGRRSGTLSVGEDVVDALRPVHLLLVSARWLTFELRQRLLPQLLDVYSRLSGGPGGQVDLASFWFDSLSIIHGTARRDVDALATRLHEGWAAILRPDVDADRLTYASADLIEGVMSTFAAPRCGWAGARWSSVDVHVDARSIRSLADGDVSLVLGELHSAINTLQYPSWVAFHPDPERLEAQVDLDFPNPRLLPVLPKEDPPRLTPRGHSALGRATDIFVEHLHHTRDRATSTIVRSADCRVAVADDGLDVVVPSGLHFDILDPFADALTGLVMDRIHLFGAIPHAPRVTVDRLTLSRETWHVDARAAPFGRRSGHDHRYAEARRWWRQLALPRRVFVKTPEETKPFYVDADSPILVDMMARAIATTAESATPDRTIRITEMLPTPDRMWLTDAAGRRYSSELRLVATDLGADGGHSNA